MEFIYGKQDFITRQRGQENCYLLTNGLGGFSCATMINSNTRNDHALLMACTEAPNHRYNLIHRLEETLERNGKELHLSSQEYLDAKKNEEGYQYLSSFSFEDTPKWIYHIDGVEIRKEIAMAQGKNLIAVKYIIENRTRDNIKFQVIPHLQFTKKGEKLEFQKLQNIIFSKEEIKEIQEQKVKASICANGHTVFFTTNGEIKLFSQKYIKGLYYTYDECDGRTKDGNTIINHSIIKEVEAEKDAVLELIYSLEEVKESADQIIKDLIAYRKELVSVSKEKNPIAAMLVKSANQFVAERTSTGGKTMLAGFPFFEDWGRDTMIAMVGCCIYTGQVITAKSILRTFSKYCYHGLMPNLFPEGENKPQYNTGDASLLFLNAVYLYYQKTNDLSFVKELWITMKEIIAWYKKGTSYGIHMDEDGLILAGHGLDQVTWMDVRIDQILPTPRHGKPVEINAYWYNALRVMNEFSMLFQEESEYAVLAEKVKQSFCKKFWNEKKNCLKDVLCGTNAEEQIRCNQIWAVSMPFTMLSEEQEKQVVDTVFEKLYTPYGLRTLEKEDPEFCATYGGEQKKRDLAYHQGTVWVYPLGAYYMAYLKTRNYTKEAVEKVESQLKVLENAMRYGCIGQLPEIYDGENPSISKGCFAQAWSVGEILRVYYALQQEKDK